jgi:hypothetical protein
VLPCPVRLGCESTGAKCHVTHGRTFSRCSRAPDSHNPYLSPLQPAFWVDLISSRPYWHLARIRDEFALPAVVSFMPSIVHTGENGGMIEWGKRPCRTGKPRRSYYRGELEMVAGDGQRLVTGVSSSSNLLKNSKQA